MVTQKIRKHSGRISAKYDEKMPFELRVEFDLLDESIYWDDWTDYRDGNRKICSGSFSGYGRLRKQTKQFNNKLMYRYKLACKYGKRYKKPKQFKLNIYENWYTTYFQTENKFYKNYLRKYFDK